MHEQAPRGPARRPAAYPAKGAPPRRTSRSSGLGLFGYAALGAVCALIAGTSFLLIAAPVDFVRDHLVDEVRARTGRDLTVAGPVSLSLFPTPGVTLSQVTLAAPAGMPGGPTVTMQRMGAEVTLGSLFSRKIQVRRIVLAQPEINLVVDRRGRRSWDFAAWPGARVRLAQARGGNLRDANPPPAPAFEPQRVIEALAVALPGEIQVTGGLVRYRDERTGDAWEITGLDLHLAANDVASPVRAQGRFALRGQPLDYSLTLSSLEGALLGGAADVLLKAKGAPMDAQFEGTLALPRGAPQVDGSIVFKSPSLAALGLWLGRPVAVSGAGAVQLSSRVKLAGQQLSLVNFDGALGNNPAQGSIVVDFRGAKPRITGSVDIAALDLGTLLMRQPGDGATPGRGDPIGDLLNKQRPPASPQVKGFTQRSGGARDWSDDQLDTRLLGLADAQVRLTAREILYHDIKTGPSRVSLALLDSQLRIDLEDIDLYQGRGRGVVNIDAAVTPPASSVNLNLENVAAGAFLKDAFGHEWLEGRTTIVVAVAGQGHTERQFVETLGGTAEIRTNGGTISGFNIPKMVRSVETGQIPALQVQPTEKTAFSELGASFVIAKGVAQNNDLRLYTQNARLTGVGTVNLTRRHLDYALKARVSGTGATPAQGAILNFSNLEIPLRAEGPWDKPTFSIQGQEQITDAIRQIGKNLKNQEVQDAIKGLLGGNPDSRVKPRDLLEKLLKKE